MQPAHAPHGTSDCRRTALIQATLRIIARNGVKGATVRAIAEEATVTQGLIRYYFSSKDELISEAYETYMADLVRLADEASCGQSSALNRLANFVKVSLESPVTSHESVSIWAGFFELLLHDKKMAASHKRSYDTLRLHLKMLFADVFEEAKQPISDQRLHRLSIAGNAVLDGLWIEGGALPEAFEDGELVQVALESFSALVNMDLCNSTAPAQGYCGCDSEGEKQKVAS